MAKTTKTTKPAEKTKPAKKTSTKPKTVQSEQNPFLVPGAIIVAGLLIATALYFSGGTGAPQIAGDPADDPTMEEISIELNSDDYIFGNADAPVKIVEFSDFNCPFCQRAHPTFKQLVSAYEGQVAWVYRHFPVLGPGSVKMAEAAECVGELGGNDSFWQFADLLFSEQYFQSEESQLPNIAVQVGVNRSEFVDCLDSGRYSNKVMRHATEAQQAGGSGTPYSVVIAPNGETFPVSGAQPYSAFEAAVEWALQN